MWKIYYEDEVFSSDDGDKKDAPARGVQAIIQDSKEVGVHVVTGGDYYIWREKSQRWVSVDIFGLFDFLIETGLVKFGRTISRDEYLEIMKEVMEDKAGWLPSERKP